MNRDTAAAHCMALEAETLHASHAPINAQETWVGGPSNGTTRTVYVFFSSFYPDFVCTFNLLFTDFM